MKSGQRVTAACIVVAVASIPPFPTGAQTKPPVLEPAARIGCVDCAGAAAFGEVQHVSVSADGRIVVIDRDEPVIRVFRIDGAVVGAFGRRGGGPGEIRLGIAAAAHRDGIDLVDMRQLRVTRYSVEGRPVRQSALTAFPIAARFDADRARWILLTSDFRNPLRLSTVVPGDSAPRALMSLTAEFPLDRNGNPSPQPAIAVAPDGSIMIGDGTGAYRLRRYSADGRPLGEIARDVERGRKSAEQLRIEQERLDAAAARMGQRLSVERGGARRATPAPERDFFHANSLAFDPHGRLWIRTARGDVGTTVFDIFSPTGVYLGERRVSADVAMFAFGASHLVAVVDATQVPILAVWRMREDR